MGLEIVRETGPDGGLCCPVIRCDWCGNLIRSMRDGVYLYRADLACRGAPTIFLHHNSSADGVRCHDSFEMANGGVRNTRFGWNHLRDWFTFINNNVPSGYTDLTAPKTQPPATREGE